MCLGVLPSLGCDDLPGEIEGSVKIDDCRQQIEVSPTDLRIVAKQFTCSTQRTISGQLMQATCARAETHWLSGACERAYVYRKRTTLRCPIDAPWLGYDAKCHAAYESGYVHASGQK